MRRLAVAAATLANHDRVAAGWPQRGIEAEAGEIPGDEFGRLVAMLLVGRVGRDRLDLQEIEQPREAAIKVGIDLVEDRWKGLGRCHRDVSLNMVALATQDAAEGAAHDRAADRAAHRAAERAADAGSGPAGYFVGDRASH